MEDRILEHYLEEFQIGSDLPSAEAESMLDAILASNNVSLIAELLSAWNDKGSTEDEIFALVQILRDRMKRIASRHETFIDIVGTGGSSAKSFNVSTAAAFVISGAGLPVAKHGNRAATSNAGSSDALTELGVEVDIDPELSEQHLNEHGLCFLFAPRFHSFSPVLSKARRMVGRPTIFNNLGPLCNPAVPPHHIIGVWNIDLLEPTARVLARLGSGTSWVVHAENGLDEIAVTGRTYVAEVSGGEVQRLEINGPDFGVYTLGKGLPSECVAAASAAIIRKILTNQMAETDAERLVLVNAAAGLYVAGKASDLSQAYQLAESSIREGSALAKLELLKRSDQ